MNEDVPLSKEKRKWSKNRDVILRGNRLSHNVGIENEYIRKLKKLVLQMTEETNKEIKKIFKHAPVYDTLALDANIGNKAKVTMNFLTNKFTKLFASKAKNLAKQIFGDVSKYSKSSLHSSLKQLTGGLSLKTGVVPEGYEDIASATIAENVSLIKSIPQEYFKQVTGSVMRSITQGQGLKDLAPEIKKYDGMTERRAKNIALDQTRKAYNTINANRLQALNIQQFEWLHSGGSVNPRESHIKMDGHIFSFDPIELKKQQDAMGIPEADQGLPSIPPNCFLGDTEVSLSNGCTNLWRYWHEGRIANISLHSGEIIRCTLNHPILTLRGWLAADEIQENDYLLSSQLDNIRIVDNEKAEVKTTFENLFASMKISGDSEIRDFSEFNFHGDIPKHQVDTIRVKDKLSNRVETMNSEKIEKFILSLSDIIANFIRLSFNSEVIEFSHPSRFREFFTLVDSESFHPYFSSMTTVSKDNSIFLQNTVDDMATCIKRFSQTQGTFLVFVSLDDVKRVRIDHVFLPRGRQNIIEDFIKTGREFIRADFMDFAKSRQAHTGLKFLHGIQHKIISEFSGHVYTLESETGWYSVSSTEIISKNCKCTFKPIIDLS